jgi:hypothetical protein
LKRNEADDERTRLLWSLRRRRFDRFRLVGWDALVAAVPEGGPVPPAVQAKLDERLPMRVYPVEGGYLYKWRYTCEQPPPEGFEVEADGWDHEHCDACNRTIAVGGTAWLTERGSFFQLCPYCYRRVVQYGARAGEQPGPPARGADARGGPAGLKVNRPRGREKNSDTTPKK